MKNDKIFLIFLLPVLFYAFLSFYKIITTSAPDFSVFYQTAQNLLAGRNIYHDQTLFTGFGYPPFSAILFLPLTVFPNIIAQGIWTAGSFAALLGSVFLSMRIIGLRQDWQKFAIITFLTYVSFPTRFTLGMGQVNLVALFLLLFALFCIKIKKVNLGGIFLGLLFILKPHFILLLPVLFIKKMWKPLGVGILIVSSAAMLTGFWFGWDLYQTYIHETFPQLMVFTGREIYYNQGLGAVFSRIVPLGLAQVLTILASLFVVIVSVWMIYKKRISGIDAMIAFLPVFLLIEPLSWQHHYIFLLPVFVWLWIRYAKTRAFLLISYLLIAANIRQPVGLSGTLSGNIILSHVFFGNILLYGLTLYAMARRPIAH